MPIATAGWSLESHYIAEFVLDAVRDARECLTEGRDNETIERRADESSSAFIAWAAKYDIGVRDGSPDAQLTLDMQSVDNVKKRLREGYQIWLNAGQPAERFRTAKVMFTKEKEDIGRYSSGKKETVFLQAWRYLS